jgi:hypothetical protein
MATGQTYDKTFKQEAVRLQELFLEVPDFHLRANNSCARRFPTLCRNTYLT